MAAGPVAADRDYILRLPHHGRDRLLDVGHHRRQLVAAGAPASVRGGLVPAGLRDRRAARLSRRAGWLDHHRGRATAVDRLRVDAHRGLGVAVADRQRRTDLVDRLWGGLPRDVSGRGRADGSPRPKRPRRDSRTGTGRSRPGATDGAAMSLPPFDFVLLWTGILGLGVFFYVLLDGFDLGVGILYGFAPDLASRNLVMNSVAPVWDGNETWLVLGGIGLLAAFPLAFAVIMPAVYFPILVMLLALVFRGVAFEFRYRDAPRRTFWDHAFCYGSAVATFAQGIVLGAFIQGFRTTGRQFSGGSFDCFTPFSLFTGIALLFGY